MVIECCGFLRKLVEETFVVCSIASSRGKGVEGRASKRLMNLRIK